MESATPASSKETSLDDSEIIFADKTKDNNTNNSLNATAMPKNAEAIRQILNSMGVTSYESRVVNQLLDLTYRYTSEVLLDAKLFAEHSGRKKLQVDDVKLAVQFRINKTFTSPPPREFYLELAAAKNSIPLPPIDSAEYGFNLPNERWCLTAANYQLEAKKSEPEPPTVEEAVTPVVVPSHRVKSASHPIIITATADALKKAAGKDLSEEAGFTITPMKRRTDDEDYDME